METPTETIIERTYSDKSSQTDETRNRLVRDARPILPFVAFFIGDIRDGLPMGTFLICLKNISKQQVSFLFLVFGVSQFVSMAPCGYLIDKSKSKIDVLICASGLVSLITLIIAIFSHENEPNLIIVISCMQGALTALVHPLLQSITLGIVGSTGFTEQVSKNRTMHHFGTALSIGSSTVIAYLIYPQIHYIFVVSPIAWLGLTYFLRKIQPKHVDTDAARSLIIRSPTFQEYEEMDEEKEEKEELANVLDMLSNKDESSDDEANYYYDYDRYNIGGSISDRHCTSCDINSVATSTTIEDRYVPPSMMYSNTSFLDNVHNPISPECKSASVASDSPCITTVEIGDNIDNQIHNSPTDNNAQPQPQQPFAATPAGTPSLIHSFFTHSSSLDPSQEEEITVKAGVGSVRNAVRKVSQKLEQRKRNLYSVYQRRAVNPVKVLMNANLFVLSSVIFFFHVSNSAVLPLVMQSLSLGDCREGMLLSGLCIFLAQFLMMIFVKIVGTYSPVYGRTNLFLFGMTCLTLRCLLLSILVDQEQQAHSWNDLQRIKSLILSTQLLDAAGAGTVGMLHILVTCDIAAATGRFALMLGFTNASMSAGGVLSGYIASVISQRYGYIIAFRILGLISILPIVIFYAFMPETLPDYERIRSQRLLKQKRKKRDRKKRNLYRIFQRIKKKKEPELNTIDHDSIT